MRLPRAALFIFLALALSLANPAPAFAHGSVTGSQDFVQDNAALIFLLALVLIGAGVLAWVMLSPQSPAEEAEDAAPPDSPTPT